MARRFKFYDVVGFKSIRELMQLAVKACGERAAFKYRSGNKIQGTNEPEITSVSYSDFYDETVCIGTGLAKLGYIGAKHVACIGENSYRWVCAFVSTLCGDNVFVPVDKELPEEDIINVLQRSDSSVLFCTSKFKDLYLKNRDKLPLISLVVCTDSPVNDGIVLSYDKLYEDGKALLDSGYTAYCDTQSDEYALKELIYTSGTTGYSKGVMLCEHNIVNCIYNGLRISPLYDTLLSILPYHHTFESCGLLWALHNHTTICINDSLRNVLANFKLFTPSYTCVVPAIAEMFYKRIMRTIEETGKKKAFDKLIWLSNHLLKIGIDMRRVFFKTIHETFGGRLIKIVSGGAPIRPEIGEFFRDIGVSLVNGYGITECSPVVSANTEDNNTFNTAGLKMPCVDIKIINRDSEGNGEICVRGDTVMLGYYKDKTLTDDALVDGWFHTGDFGNIDSDNLITVTGRKKNIIVLNNGKNIYPEELEDFILTIPYVNEVVVYASKDENGNQSGLCAEAFLDAAKMAEMRITDAAKKIKEDICDKFRSLPVYKQISRVVLRKEEFEKTTTRKIKRGKIKAN